MTILNLSPMRVGHEFPVKPERGKWFHTDGTLKQLGRALRVKEDNPFADPDEPIRAIPDPWAQARVFGDALRDKDHSMHSRALSQWRGLLALFALRKFHPEYSIEPVHVPLDGDHILARILTTLPPEIAIKGEAAQWRSPWIFMLGIGREPPKPLGLSNPICLVSPGRQSHLIVIPGVAWAQGDLCDPLGLPSDKALSAPQIVALGKWLRKMLVDLKDYPGDVATALRELVSLYAQDCTKQSGNADDKIATVSDPDQNGLPELFRPLFRPVELGKIDDPAALSQTRIRLRQGATLGALKGLILVDPGIAATPGVNPRTTFVWGLKTLAELLRSPEAFEAARRDAAAHGYWLVTANDLFTSRAVHLANDGLVPSHPVGLQEMLLPLRPLSLLVADNLKERISGQLETNRASVSLKLMLERASGDDFPLTLTRHFSVTAKGEEPLLVRDGFWQMTNVTLWPNFKSSAWDTYALRLLYQDRAKDAMARPNCGISASLLAAEAAGCPTAEAVIARLQALNERILPALQPGRFTRSYHPRETNIEDVQIATDPFEAISYVEAVDGRSSAPGGMVLLDLTVQEPTKNGTRVSVDFGTTNTVACIDNDEADPVTFVERLVFPVQFRLSDSNIAARHNARHRPSIEFLPPEDRKTPTPTVAFVRMPYPNKEEHSLLRSIVYFHPSLPHAEDDEDREFKRFADTVRNLRFNLKWSSEASAGAAATDFLEQFMMMTSAEVLASGFDPRRTEWLFSIPDAMSVTRRDEFRDYLVEVTARVSNLLAADADSPEALGPLQSEGLSAARYMIGAAGFNADALNIVFDIGGGTTDITIWDREELRWRGSFLLAGQNFFTRLLTSNLKILREIHLTGWADVFDVAKALPGDLTRDQIPHLAEMLFSGSLRPGVPNLQRAIDENWTKVLNKDVGAPLRIAGLVFIAGLAWYVGRVVKMLVEKGDLDAEICKHPAFALCGRGAGLFKKIHGERRANEASVVTRALAVYATSAGIVGADRPELRTTPQAKLEVVRGMLTKKAPINANAEDGADGAAITMPSGLSLSYRGGTSVAPDDIIAAGLVDQKVDRIDLAEIDLFLNALGSATSLKVDMGGRGDARGFIQDEVRKEIDQAASGKDSSRSPEPPFIIALRALVAELAASAEQRQGRISAKFAD